MDETNTPNINEVRTDLLRYYSDLALTTALKNARLGWVTVYNYDKGPSGDAVSAGTYFVFTVAAVQAELHRRAQDAKTAFQVKFPLHVGETIEFIAELPPSVWDPAGKYSGISRRFRVIAYGGDRPYLNLIPIEAKANLVEVETK